MLLNSQTQTSASRGEMSASRTTRQGILLAAYPESRTLSGGS
jgi:hypothetical protein